MFVGLIQSEWTLQLVKLTPLEMSGTFPLIIFTAAQSKLSVSSSHDYKQNGGEDRRVTSHSVLNSLNLELKFQ